MSQAGVGDGAGRTIKAREPCQVVIPEHELLKVGQPPQVSQPLVSDLRVPQVEPPEPIAVILDKASEIGICEVVPERADVKRLGAAQESQESRVGFFHTMRVAPSALTSAMRCRPDGVKSETAGGLNTSYTDCPHGPRFLIWVGSRRVRTNRARSSRLSPTRVLSRRPERRLGKSAWVA